jgi:5S rRNA maturation endonuclease (ribonuclease M5)
MDQKLAREFLVALGVGVSEYKAEWVTAPCPMARWRHASGKDSHPSFGIRLGGKPHYNCFACNKGGDLAGLLDELIHLSKNDPVPTMDIGEAYRVLEQDSKKGYITQPEWKMYETHEDSVPIAWPEWWLESFFRARDCPVARDYLIKRAVPQTLWDTFDIRYDTSRNAVCLPVRDRDSRLVGMRGRHLDPMKEPRYHDYDFNDVNNTSKVWYNEDRIVLTKPIVLVEGAFDLIRVYQCYRNVLSPLSAQMSISKIKKLLVFPQVFCLFDNDKAGQIAYEKVKMALGKRIAVRQLKLPEGVKDPGEAPISLLSDLLLKFKLLDLP